MDVCAGGTINAGATSITFTNHHTVKCTITSCNMPGWPTTDPVIPKQENGVAGTQVVIITVPAVAGNTYNYTPNCCDQGTPPQIKVQ